jgi:pimeloyl-ACP methyl ester carboxylesterase
VAEPHWRSASAGSQRFVYTDTGSGPPVVLLHGFPDTPHGWADTVKALNAGGYRTIVPYLRGYHPETIVSGRPYRAREIAEDAIRLLDAAGIERAVLVGHDWGASIVYRAAVLAPERVRAICALAIPHPQLLGRSPALLWRGRHFITLSLPSGRWLARRRDFAYLDTLMRRWAPNWSGPSRDQALADVKRCFVDQRVLDAALCYYRDASLGDELDSIAQPGLVIGGTSDIIDVHSFTRSKEVFDGPCEVLIFDGAGHWPHREAPEAFHAHLQAFLDELPAS